MKNKLRVTCRESRVAKMAASFGIVEVLIAGVLIITVIGASVAIRQRAGSQATFAQRQAVAYMLAQEGIEAVRHIRDNNYLIKQRDESGSLVKAPWHCGFFYQYRLSYISGQQFIECQTTNLMNSANLGNFSLPASPNQPVSELGSGMPGSAIFVDESTGLGKGLPSWHLSANGAIDAGVRNGDSSAANAMMRADRCVGAERIFVRKGNLGSGSTASVLTNLRDPANTVASTQQNYQAGSEVVGCTRLLPPSGFDEYRRQVIVTPGGPSNESYGNLPADWRTPAGGIDISSHMARVLVRVSWQEESRNVAAGEERAVLLATYLTDWRPAN